MRALEETLRQIFPLDSVAETTCRTRLAATPSASPDVVEAAARLSGIYRGKAEPRGLALALFTAEHGIAVKRETPCSNISGKTSQHIELSTYLVDMRSEAQSAPPGTRVLRRPMAAATHDIGRGPAMSIAAARQSVENGISLADELREYPILAIGCESVGVAYVTCAICARLLGAYQASELPNDARADWVSDILSTACDGKTGLELLAAVGGFDLGGAAGLMLALAARRRAILLTDFASSAAAMIAIKLEPFVRDYLFTVAAQCPLHLRALTWLGTRPLAPFVGDYTESLSEAVAALTAASRLIEDDRA
ncbi:MAG: nicotinate-nucleotide--dimethylbenzimidazole phosphoribosyltransferase [Desulfobulbaceae bacterium]|nr:nicotinate-nucleotide--dimethylbenzimidazole phosphoribosyltransferase [Desulfobulbaceae bacterium]